METENIRSGGSGGRCSKRVSQDFGPPRREVKQRTELPDADAYTKIQESPAVSASMAEIGSEAGMESRQKHQASDDGSVEDEEGGLGTLQEEPIMSKEMEADVQILRQKVDNFTQQVSGLLDAGKTYFLDASNAFEESIVELHQKVLEGWEGEIEELRNLDAVNEDIKLRLGNARSVLGLLEVSSKSDRDKDGESPECL